MNNSYWTTFPRDVQEKAFQYAEVHVIENDVKAIFQSTELRDQSSLIYGILDEYSNDENFSMFLRCVAIQTASEKLKSLSIFQW